MSRHRRNSGPGAPPSHYSLLHQCARLCQAAAAGQTLSLGCALPPSGAILTSLQAQLRAHSAGGAEVPSVLCALLAGSGPSALTGRSVYMASSDWELREGRAVAQPSSHPGPVVLAYHRCLLKFPGLLKANQYPNLIFLKTIKNFT